MKKKQAHQRIQLILMCLFFVFAHFGCGKYDKSVVKVDEKEISMKKAGLYLQVVWDEYEQLGGDEIWDMKIGSLNAQEAAFEAALDSLIENAVVYNHLKSAQRRLSEEEKLIVQDKVQRITDTYPELLKKWKISFQELEDFVQEDYCTEKFMSTRVYEVDENELTQRMESYFQWYDCEDPEEYMQKVQLDAIVLYKGQIMDGEWVAYSKEGREEQYEQITEIAQKLAEGASFAHMKGMYSEEKDLNSCIVFTQGLIQSSEASVFYKGQMDRNLWNAVFSIPKDTVSQVIECEWAYLIVRVKDYPESGSSQEYKNSLRQCKEAYYEQLSEELIGSGLANMVAGWKENSIIKVDHSRWKKLTESFSGRIGSG